jgi:hypothetical protein
LQILEEQAEFKLSIEARLRRTPNAPGTSKRKHFEAANQKRRKDDFTWSPGDQPEQTKRQTRKQQTRTSEPHVEPPRPPGWTPLVLTRVAIQIPDDTLERGNDMLVEGLA